MSIKLKKKNKGRSKGVSLFLIEELLKSPEESPFSWKWNSDLLDSEIDTRSEVLNAGSISTVSKEAMYERK